MDKQPVSLSAGTEVVVRRGAYTRSRATILPRAAQRRRTNTICVRFHEGVPSVGGKERWVSPDRIEDLPEYWAPSMPARIQLRRSKGCWRKNGEAGCCS